jgi:tRNA(Ile)-lysidine synthase
LLKDFNFTEWDDITNLLEAQSGKKIFSETHRLIKDRNYLLLTELTVELHSEIIISEKKSKVEMPLGIINFKTINQINKSNALTIYVDKDQLKFPLTLRKWEEGDFFYPFGMKGKKKLSKYFKDEKLSLVDKENVWLLTSENEIVWVVGKRADDRFKITESTKKILKIELK